MVIEQTRTEAALIDRPRILDRMSGVEGWFAEAEAELLITIVDRALQEFPAEHAVVEIGSYCGRSTVVIGSVIKAVNPEARVYAIDAHEGQVGALDQGIIQTPPTLEQFQRNIADAGLTEIVVPIRQYSYEVEWARPISLLFIDGLHDYANVARDFAHFESWIAAGGYVAFHDYGDYFPGVKTFVNELFTGGRFEQVACADSLMVVRNVAIASAGQNNGHHTELHYAPASNLA